MRFTTTLALSAAAVLAAAAPAHADSLTYIKDHNVWLSNPDGTGQYQVTADGSADNPYQSPSQTDDGRIVTMRAKPNGAPLFLLRQNGELLGRIPVGAVQAGPMQPHVAPDGRHVAFGIVRGGYVNGWYELQSTVRVATLDGTEVSSGGANASTPSWLDANTVLTGAGPVAKLASVTGGLTSWWSDYDHYADFGQGEDLRDGEAAGGRAVFVRGEGDGKTMNVYSAPRMTAALPAPTCVFSDPAPGPLGARFADPTLSPDGRQMAWQEGNGVWTVAHPDPSDCRIQPRLLIAGASEPDWSPAPNAPGPRPAPPAPPAPPVPPAPAPVAPGATPAKATVKVSSASRRAIVLRITGAKGRVTARLGGAKASGTARPGRALTLTLTPKRRLRAGARVKVSVALPGESARTLEVRVKS